MVECRWGGCRNGDRRHGEKGFRAIVLVIMHLVLGPDDSIGMVGAFFDPAAVREGKSPANTVPSGISRSVNRGGRGRRSILRNPFHDVLLTAGWPAYAADVSAQHPECRPEASGRDELHPCFHSSELKCVSPRRPHTSRGPCS